MSQWASLISLFFLTNDKICLLFQCPRSPITQHLGAPTLTLAQFVGYARHRTQLSPAVTLGALLLLWRLKFRFPGARGSCGYRRFLSAFRLASKIFCDEIYSARSSCIVGQDMLQPGEINQMKRELCAHLEYNLHVTQDQLAVLESYMHAQKPTVVPRIAGAQLPKTSEHRQVSSSRAALGTTLCPLQCHPYNCCPSPQATAKSNGACFSGHVVSSIG